MTPTISERIGREIREAQDRYGYFASTHEGYGVLAEEVSELLDAIRRNDPFAIESEAIQVAAVATRIAISLIDGETCQRSGFHPAWREIARIVMKHSVVSILVWASLIVAGPSAAQTYTHQVDPAQYDNGPSSIPYPEIDLSGQPISIMHEKWQFHTGTIPAFHNGPVSSGFLAGPGFGVNDTPLCDGTLWADERDWSHGHFGVNDCVGPCQVVPVRWMKCDSVPLGHPLGPLQPRDAHVYWQTSTICQTCPRAPMLYAISQYGPSTGLRDGAPSQHSGPMLREILVHNSGGRVMVWGSNLDLEPSSARIRVAGWDWNGTSHLLLDADIPDWPQVNPAIAATWPEGVDLQWIVVDGAADVASWWMGDLQLNVVPEPGSIHMLVTGMALLGALGRIRE